MTQFKKENFDMGEGSERWVTYYIEGKGYQFIGRFKYMNPGRCANHFVKFLIKNFTVEEYFKLVNEDRMSPLHVLQTKGYVNYNVTQQLKEKGYPITQEGFNRMIQDDIDEMEQKKSPRVEEWIEVTEHSTRTVEVTVTPII